MLRSKKFFIFDMDGTIYLGDKPLPNAVHLLHRLLEDKERRFIYFTNNASKSPAVYVEKLRRLGFPANDVHFALPNNIDFALPVEKCSGGGKDVQSDAKPSEGTPKVASADEKSAADTVNTHRRSSDILTSGDVTAQFLLTHRQGKKVYLLGTDALRTLFIGRGVPLFEPPQGEPPYCQIGAVPDIVVSSFDTSLAYTRLERACTYIRRGAEWLTTHPDINCPVENGFIPDSGAINELIRTSTGASALPRAFGKPSPEVVEMIEEIYGVPRAGMAVFGDRLYTDIALGKRNSLFSVLLLTGEATREEATLSEATLDKAQAVQPDLIFEDLFEVERALYGE